MLGEFVPFLSILYMGLCQGSLFSLSCFDLEVMSLGSDHSFLNNGCSELVFMLGHVFLLSQYDFLNFIVNSSVVKFINFFFHSFSDSKKLSSLLFSSLELLLDLFLVLWRVLFILHLLHHSLFECLWHSVEVESHIFVQVLWLCILHFLLLFLFFNYNDMIEATLSNKIK